MRGSKSPRTLATDYEHRVRAGLTQPTTFRDAVGVAFSAVVLNDVRGYTEHLAATSATDDDSDAAWKGLARNLGMAPRTLRRSAHGERYPSLEEIDALLSHKRLGECFRIAISTALVSPQRVLHHMPNLAERPSGASAPVTLLLDELTEEEAEQLATSTRQRIEVEQRVRMYIGVLADMQEDDALLGNRTVSRIDWIDIFDRVEVQDPKHPDYVPFSRPGKEK